MTERRPDERTHHSRWGARRTRARPLAGLRSGPGRTTRGAASPPERDWSTGSTASSGGSSIPARRRSIAGSSLVRQGSGSGSTLPARTGSATSCSSLRVARNRSGVGSSAGISQPPTATGCLTAARPASSEASGPRPRQRSGRSFTPRLATAAAKRSAGPTTNWSVAAARRRATRRSSGSPPRSRSALSWPIRRLRPPARTMPPTASPTAGALRGPRRGRCLGPAAGCPSGGSRGRRNRRCGRRGWRRGR